VTKVLSGGGTMRSGAPTEAGDPLNDFATMLGFLELERDFSSFSLMNLLLQTSSCITWRLGQDEMWLKGGVGFSTFLFFLARCYTGLLEGYLLVVCLSHPPLTSSCECKSEFQLRINNLVKMVCEY
jgi:hypothetical protein